MTTIISASPTFYSPLKKEECSQLQSEYCAAKRRLFDEKPNEEAPREELTLSEIYQMDFEKPGADAFQFFAVREQVMAIETWMTQHSVDVAAIRALVLNCLKCADYEKKMAELGLLLFYLDKNGEIPKADSLLEYRASELKEKTEGYINSHQVAGASRDIPSGKIHYLMRAFVHMLFVQAPSTQTQLFNRGGLIVIKQLLMNPCFGIAKFLQPEHREHILIVVDQMIYHSAMENLFKKKLVVHSELQDVVRFNLKLKPKEEISSIHAFYDCMMTLFADIRQNTSPNCYAISGLIYAIENHTYKVLCQLMEWLTKGHVSFHATNIPIQPLIEKRLVASKDLQQNLESSAALSLAPLDNLAHLLALDVKDKKSGELSVGNILSELLKDNNALNLQNDAEKYYCTYKYHTLTHLLLAILEISSINHRLDGNSPLKEELIQACLSAVKKMPEWLKPKSNVFIERLKTKLESRLWLENCEGVDLKTVANVQGDSKALTRLFKAHHKIFHLISGNYLPLDSLTKLQEMVVSAIQDVKKELEQEGHLEEAKAAAKYIKSTQLNFRATLTDHAAKQIDIKGISGKVLNQSDLLVLKDKGGWMETALEVALGIKVATQEIGNCKTAYDFLEKLIGKFKKLDLNLFEGSRRLILQNRQHTWTLSPGCWKILLENRNNFYPFMQKKVFDPAKAKLDSVVAPELLERVIRCYSCDVETYSTMLLFFCERPQSTHLQFMKDLLEGADEEDKSLMRTIIEEEFSKVYLKKNDLEKVLQQLSVLPDNPEILEKLYQKMNLELMQPYQLASRLRLLLIDEKLAILDPYLIEQTLCQVLKLPITIQLGDLNWADAYREDPEHLHLMIVFSWVLMSLVYVERTPNEQRIQNHHDYSWFQMQYPQIYSNS